MESKEAFFRAVPDFSEYLIYRPAIKKKSVFLHQNIP